MADHLDAPGLKSPNMNAEIDITDHYAFQKPGDPTKSILIFNVNPLAPTLADAFDAHAIYEILVDNNGDARADVAFKITFSAKEAGQQHATVRLATGEQARAKDHAGTVVFEHVPVSFGAEAHVATRDSRKFFAGIRSDPFFFDLQGFLNGLKFTGADFFADKNVFSMALEVPNSNLGEHSALGIWTRTLMPAEGGGFTQVDQMGRPAINTVFNHGDAKNLFNHIEPVQERELFLASFVETLIALSSLQTPTAQGPYTRAEATAIAEILLPDVLTYDDANAGGFLNGRKLTDDVIDIELNLVTHGAVTGDGVGPHHDLLDHFPYVGNPH